MWKALGLLVAGLAAGAAVFLYTHSGSESESLLVKAADAQGVDVQKSLAALDRRVRDLTAQVQMLQSSSSKPVAAGDRTPAANGQRRQDGQGGRNIERSPEELAAMQERRQEMQKQREERDNERIRAAGLTPERLTAINRRIDELRVAAQQAQFEAQRTGQRVDGTNVEATLRKELGDAEYERYLKATGRPTEVRVMEVLATSNAERSGLKAGDEIMSYNGKRVFDSRDLNTLTSQAAVGGSVTVEVKRNGQTMQVSVPAGPLGVQAGGGGGRGGAQGGPGGFGGGGPGGGGFRGGRPAGP
ncbi:MAG: PDZ domain-containing protein [Pseudomonadota bacterium]